MKPVLIAILCLLSLVLGTQGADKDLHTPHLDRLAREGGCIRPGILSGKAGATQ
jgi:hypothetical protein